MRVRQSPALFEHPYLAVDGTAWLLFRPQAQFYTDSDFIQLSKSKIYTALRLSDWTTWKLFGPTSGSFSIILRRAFAIEICFFTVQNIEITRHDNSSNMNFPALRQRAWRRRHVQFNLVGFKIRHDPLEAILSFATQDFAKKFDCLRVYIFVQESTFLLYGMKRFSSEREWLRVRLTMPILWRVPVTYAKMSALPISVDERTDRQQWLINSRMLSF